MTGSRVAAWSLLLATLVAFTGRAQAQVCNDELLALQALQQKLRAAVLAGNAAAAVSLASTQKLEPPPGYDFENQPQCRKWALEVANMHRASCAFEGARAQLKSIKTEQFLAIDALRSAIEGLSHSATAPFSCKDKQDLYLICEPISDSAPDAWCARRVEHDERLEFPRSAWCKLVDGHGVELSTVNEDSEPTCREELEQQKRAQRDQLRSQRRGTVAVAGTGIALMAAIAIPFSFVPEGTAKLLHRLHAIDHDSYRRLRHRSFRARQRVLPLLAVTALSVSSLSSRYWWAGVLAAGSGISADVLLAQHWHHHDPSRRNIGIATAALGAVAGLALNLETMGSSEAGSRYGMTPTLRVGIAQAELGIAGRF
jgi:hypothetical protein